VSRIERDVAVLVAGTSGWTVDVVLAEAGRGEPLAGR
jgi:hypothetical protein